MGVRRTAGMRAQEALAATPGKSDRAIAAAAGVSHMTVRRLRAGVTFSVPPAYDTAGGPPLENVTPAPTASPPSAPPVTNAWPGRIEDITPEARTAARAAGITARADLLKLASYADEDALWAVEQIAAEIAARPKSLGKRLIKAAEEAISICRGEADAATYCVHSFSPAERAAA